MKENFKNLIIRVLDEMGQPSVKSFVDKIKINYRTKSTEVANKFYFLWKNGVLDFSNNNIYLTLSDRLFSLKNLWFWFLTVFVALTPLVVFYVSESPFIYLRYFLSLFYIIYLPGSMFIETLYPKQEDLLSLERLSLSIGSSLVIIILTGFLLNLLPWGVELTSATLSLAILTESLGVVALMRKNKYSAIDSRHEEID